MGRWGYLASLVVLVMLLTSCMSGGVVSSPGNIVGEVKFVNTYEPVVGAEVYIDGKYWYTDQYGEFRFTGVRAGTHTLRITYRNKDYKQGVNIPSNGTLSLTGSRAILIDPQDAPIGTGDVGGYVYIRSGSQPLATATEIEALFSAQATPPMGYAPLVGATVEVAGREEWTNRDGRFYISNITPGNYTLTVAHSLLRFKVEEGITIRAQQVTWLDGYRNPAIVGGIGYYIVIGIDQYPGEAPLLGPVQDAQLVYQNLFDGNKLAGLGKLLINPNASKIKAAIDEAIGMAKGPDDYLVIYFSGRSGQDYLSPSDDDGSSWAKVITDSDLELWTRSFQGSVTLIIDGADSQSMADGIPFRPLALRERKYTVLSAAKKGQMVNYDPNLRNSVFTHFLTEGIRTRAADGAAGGAPNRDITAYELYRYIDQEMYWYYNRYTDSDSHQPSIHEGFYGDSVIFRY